jgi:Beta protein
MINYIPFLKAKRGEFNAMSELVSEVKQAICPFFDFPRKKDEYDSDSYSRTTLGGRLKGRMGNAEDGWLAGCFLIGFRGV